MDEALQIAKRSKLDKLWADFFYEANVAFNVARHPAFIAAVNATATAGIDYDPLRIMPCVQHTSNQKRRLFKTR